MSRQRMLVSGLCLVIAGCGRAEVAPTAPVTPPRTEEARTQEPITVDPADWPWWRGPSRNGVADSKQAPPTKWSESANVLWKSPVPGRGHGSPIVVGERVILAAAEPEHQQQWLVCFERSTGKLLWQTEVHRGGLEIKGHPKATLASSTPASDGQRVFVSFVNGGAIQTSALDLEGKVLWQTKVTDYAVHQGFGSSPALFGPLVIVSADNTASGAVAALDRSTGKLAWWQPRPPKPNYTSPVVLEVAGRPQVVVAGCDLVSAFEPLTGEKLWELAGGTTECVASPVADDARVFCSGGYPRNYVAAVRADGSAQSAWENNSRIYVPSMVVKDGHLYAVLDAGVATCWKSDSGKELWKERLDGTFSSSLVVAGDLIYATNEAGRTYVFKAQPERFELVADNQLGDEVLSSPAICGGRIYQRVALVRQGQRQEMLYCLGEESSRKDAKTQRE